MGEPLPVEPVNGAGVMPDDPSQDEIDQDPQPQFDVGEFE
jgi:hypothetical protein